VAFPFNSRFDQLGGGAFTLRIREKAEAGRVQLPYYYYDIVAEGVPVGKISVRIGDNYHTYYNGHIGYEVDVMQIVQVQIPVAAFAMLMAAVYTIVVDTRMSKKCYGAVMKTQK